MRGMAPAFLALALVVFGSCGAAAAPVVGPAIGTSATVLAAGGGSSKFGLVTHIATRYGQYGQQGGPIDMAAGTGTGWVREEVRWDWIEHPLGTNDWGFTDEMVTKSRGRGLEILGVLGYNNAAQKAGVVDYNMPDIATWKRYVATAVGHYKGQIHTWEVWNEPDVPYFWKGSVADYINLLRETYATIKAVDPTAIVMNGACSDLSMNWFNDFVNQGGTQYTDVLAFHPYPKISSIDNGAYENTDLAHLRDIGIKVGKPWWFTEIGWSSAPKTADYDNTGVGGDQAQASYMVRQYTETLSFNGLNVDHIFWYNFHNDGTDPNNAENNYGLVQNDWVTPKYAYSAYQQMTIHLAGATPLGRIDAGAGPAYRFNRNGIVVDVVWGNGHATLPTTASTAQAYDLTGAKLSTTLANGQIGVELNGAPIYVEHTSNALAPLTAAVGGIVTGGNAPSLPALPALPVAPFAPPSAGSAINRPGYPAGYAGR